MRKIFCFVAIAFAIMSCAAPQEQQGNDCNHRREQSNDTKPATVTGVVYSIEVDLPHTNLRMHDKCAVIVIDSCEYLYTGDGKSYYGGGITHKGNCKYCAERRKKEIEAAVRKMSNQNNYSNYGKSETDDSMSDLW